MSPFDLQTPCALLDLPRLRRNIEAMSSRARDLGVDLRPHLKTAKCLEAGRMATSGHTGAIAVSTLREAEFFFTGGFQDILYAVSVVPGKLQRAAALLTKGADLTLILDSAETARSVAESGRELGVVFPVLLEVDCDGERAGIKPDSPELIEAGRALARGGAELQGVMTHAGASYDCRGDEELAAMAEQERAAAVMAAERLREAGLPCPVVSVGSTPTATFAERLDGVTELRAGAYMFQDLFQAGLGVCSEGDIALSVLTTVISRRPERGWLITDAGALALSKDRSTAALPDDELYGVVCDAHTCAPIDELRVVGVNQEHGMVGAPAGSEIDWDRFPIGTQLRVLPNHACMTAAAYDRYQVIDEDRAPVAIWERCNRW